MDSQQGKSVLSVRQQFAEAGLTVAGFFGILMTAVGLTQFYLGQRFEAWDEISAWAGAMLTPSATIIVALSIFLPPHQRKADWMSRYVTMWITIVLSIAAMIIMIYHQTIINDVVTGIGIMGLAGGCLRMLPFSSSH